jgi:nitrogen fixation/metabolism regulation signal transduction histidine kinase
MGFKDFRFGVLWRIIVISLTIAGVLYFSFIIEQFISAGIVFIIFIFLLVELFGYVTKTNRKLTRFLESIKYADFISGFSVDDKLGSSFQQLNTAFNEVMDAFRKERSEKEEHLQYLNTVVEHVSTGLLAYNEIGEVELINATAKKYLQSPQIHNIEELIDNNSRLYKALFDLQSGKSVLFRSDEDVQLAIHATIIRLKGSQVKLIALQNIQPELQKKELEAWQNLTKVLRHEIMNSITPISSLTSTLKVILMEDLKQKGDIYTIDAPGVDDLQEGLNTIENRTKGLINFINAYRDYTNIPQPKLQDIKLSELLDHVSQLMKVELRKNNISFKCTSDNITLSIDPDLIEMVLINLVKNGIEASVSNESPIVSVIGLATENSVSISISDNGDGIIPEAIDKIFIPFFSTKKTGSGIGLSLSRQIMQLHQGTLTVKSSVGKGSTFVMRF